ncbi:unnamed protein product, partial [Laminaria digitata]
IKKKTLPLVWLLLGLMAFYPMAQHAWSGIVLCIGADGHIELEDGRASDCATDVGKAASETHYDHAIAEVVLEEFEDCGPCVDVALLTSPFDGQRASKVDVSASPEALLQVTSQTVLPDNNRVSSLVPRSSVTTLSPFFAPLRTIALLI